MLIAGLFYIAAMLAVPVVVAVHLPKILFEYLAARVYTWVVADE